MPRQDSERINHFKHNSIISEYFDANKNNIVKKGTSITPIFYKNGKKIGIIETMKYLYQGEKIEVKFKSGLKYDFVVDGEIKIEVKEDGDLFCETLSLSKNPENIKVWEKWCASKKVDPIEANNIALKNFINDHGSEYVEAALNKLSDYILIHDVILSREEFLEKYKLYASIYYTPYYRFQIKFELNNNDPQISSKKRIENINEDVESIYQRKIKEWKENQKKQNKSNMTPGEGTRLRIRKESEKEYEEKD